MQYNTTLSDGKMMGGLNTLLQSLYTIHGLTEHTAPALYTIHGLTEHTAPALYTTQYNTTQYNTTLSDDKTMGGLNRLLQFYIQHSMWVN